MDLPLFEALMRDGSERILNSSLVDYPATKSNFIYFNDQKKQLMYAVQNEEQRVVFGVIMRADQKIYRRDANGFEYYIFYSKDTIKKMSEKLLLDGNHNNINLMHAPGTDMEGINCFQLFIKDKARGVDPVGFDDIEDGSLFGAYHVENEALWQAIKDGTFRGMSLEGYFEVKPVENKQSKNQKNSMSKLKNALRRLLAEFGEIETNKGILSYEGELAVGVEVTIDGEMAADGEYEAEDKVIVVADGKVAEIREKEAPAEATETPAEATETPAEAQENEEVAPVEEKPVVEVVEDVVEEQTRDLEAEIDALKAEIELLKEQIAELVGKPVDPPVEEQFEAVKDKNEKKSKIEQRMAYLRK